MDEFQRDGAARRRLGKAALGGLALLLSGVPVRAQELPDQIRVIVPLATGSSLDARARVVVEAIGRQIGRRVIVENRPGAGGTLGTLAVARAKPDGSTLLFNNNSHVIAPHVYPAPGYDPLKDFASVIQAYDTGLVLVVHPSLGTKTLKELIAAAGRGQVPTYASSGTGGLPHLAMEMLKDATGMAPAHVPYKGDGPALVDVLAGRVPVMISGYPAALAHVQSGSLRALAVTSRRRASMFADAPTMAEAGYPGATVDTWAGFYVPAKTPKAIVDRLHREIAAAMKQPLVQEHYIATGAQVATGSPAEFAAFTAKESERYGKLVRTLNLKPE